MKHLNNKPMKLTKSGIEEMAASVVPAGRTCFTEGFPGTSSLANIHGRFATLHNSGGNVVRRGKRRFGRRGFTGVSGPEMGKACNFYCLATGLTRLFPHKSTQVVDFPRIAYVRLFWGGAEIGFSVPTSEVVI
jgi:hypothetical protein